MKRDVKSPATFKLLRLFCPEHLREEIEGDLVQRYERDLKLFGERRAKRRLLWSVLRFFRPGIILRNHFSFNFFGMSIFTHYLTFTQRVLFRHKLFSAINLAGLAIGMALCMLMVNYVLFERSYDRFHANADRIVRVSYDRIIDGKHQFTKAQVFPGVGEAVKSEIPEVEDMVRMFPFTTHVEAFFSTPGSNEKFVETGLFAVDKSFLKIFSLPLIHGDPGTALDAEKKMIVSQSTARKYFGSDDVVNKTIHWDGMGDWTVTGVFYDLPENSHMKFDMLIGWEKVYGDLSVWNWDGFYTYLLLAPDADRASTELKIQALLDRKILAGDTKARVRSQFHLQPLTEIHLNSALLGEMRINGNASVVDGLLVAAIGVLLLALVNYLNLSMARIIRRTREVGVRKVIGSSRRQLMSLFFTEAALLNTIAFCLAVILFFLLLPLVGVLTGKAITPSVLELPMYYVLFVPLGLMFFSWAAGFYPAKLITALQPAQGIKGLLISLKRPRFSKVLLVIQFSVTMILLGGAMIVQRQLSYMQSRDLGFESDQRLVIRCLGRPGAEMDTTYIQKMRLFREKIQADDEIKSSTLTSNIPGRENEWIGRLKRVDESNDQEIMTSRTRVDEDYIKTYGLELVAGRNFTDVQKHHVIINESAVKMLGYESNEDALGALIMRDYEIIGVIRNFHERSLQETITPAVYTMGAGYMKFVTIHLNSADMQEKLAFIESQWKSVFPDRPFEYFFLDDFFNQQYKKEIQLGRVISIFSTLGIFIACIGLFGFTYFMIHQRVKEIGIRKVLGASGLDLQKLLYGEFFWLVIIAGVAASPIAWWLAENWLSDYAYRIPLNAVHLLLPVIIVALIAFATIVALVVRAIRANPTESLKYE